MQSFIGISHLVLILQMQLVPAQITPPAEEAGPREITMIEAYRKSMCQPMEQLVDVEQEVPGEEECIYVPSCVPLQRCSGCCMDERLECHPTLERNVTVELMRIVPQKFSKQVELIFVEHQRCECRVRQKVKKGKSNKSIKTKPWRKNKKTANGYRKCQFPWEQNSLH